LLALAHALSAPACHRPPGQRAAASDVAAPRLCARCARCAVLQVPQLQQRDATCWQLARQLAAADVADARAVRQLLAAVVQAEAGGG
jgi:hypothetical protein